jgi:hypothetical protein
MLIAIGLAEQLATHALHCGQDAPPLAEEMPG